MQLTQRSVRVSSPLATGRAGTRSSYRRWRRPVWLIVLVVLSILIIGEGATAEPFPAVFVWAAWVPTWLLCASPSKSHPHTGTRRRFLTTAPFASFVTVLVLVLGPTYPGIAFRLSRPSMQRTANRILDDHDAWNRADFATVVDSFDLEGVIPVVQIDITRLGAARVVRFETAGFAFVSYGYAYSDSEIDPETVRPCSYSPIGGRWYQFLCNYN